MIAVWGTRMISTKPPVFNPVPASAVTRKLDDLSKLLDTATVKLDNGEQGVDLRKLSTDDPALQGLVQMFKDGFANSTGGIPFLSGSRFTSAKEVINTAKGVIAQAAGDDQLVQLEEATPLATSVVPGMVRTGTLFGDDRTNANALASVAMAQVTAQYDDALNKWTEATRRRDG